VIAYCLAKPGAEETYPFGDHVLVAKVGGKAFAFIGQDDPPSVGLKCGATAEEAAELRARHPSAVSVMAYLGRYGWNSVTLAAAASATAAATPASASPTASSAAAARAVVPPAELAELLDASYDAVVAKLPKSRRP
jgi:predicted DNA-binding protein (MmcQ/YjbR family)